MDGVDIRDMPRDSAARERFGMVLQDTWLFSGTIHGATSATASSDATDEEVRQAARLAYADRFMRTLPDGYDTKIDEEPSNLLPGQKQLLTIARAILSDPAS